MGDSALNHISRATSCRWLARLCWFLPPAALALLLWRNAVDVPYWDEWDDELGGLFAKAHAGTLSFGDFWAQHNESRFVLPRLIYLLLGGFVRWELLHEVAFTFLLAIAAAAGLFWLGKKAFPDRPLVRWLAFLLASLLIFSPAQFEAWLWGMELILYLPLVFILGGLLLLQTRLSTPAKISGCALLATASTYSFANGLLAWLVLFPPIFLADGFGGLKRNRRAALLWIFAFLANVGIYFQNYVFPDSPGLAVVLRADPWRVAKYFCTFLGGPLTNPNSCHAVEIAASIGAVELALVAVVTLLLFRRRKSGLPWPQLWPWPALGAYGLLSAALATSGRAAFGAEQALSSRYGVFGVCVLVALIYLLPQLASNSSNARPMRTALAAFAGLIILLHGWAFVAGAENFAVFRLERLHAKACLKFINVLLPQPATRLFLFPNFFKVQNMANQLDRAGVWNYSLHRSRKLADFKLARQPGVAAAGYIELSHFFSGANLFMSGWALDHARRGAADCVVFTSESPGLEPEIVALMDRRRLRPDLETSFGQKKFWAAGWEKLCPLAELPKGSLTIKAWSYDVQTDQLLQLAKEIRLENK